MPVTRPDVPNDQALITTQSGSEGGGDTSNVRATPEAFGAGVGKAVEGAGQAGFDATMRQQGLINETMQNNAEVGFIQAAGNLKAKYTQYEGLQAEAMRPQYEAELAQAHAQFRKDLPPVVQKSYDATTMHQLAYQTGEYSQYAAGQIKSANLKSQDAVKDTAVAGAGNLSAVLDDNQFNAMKDTIRYTGNTVAGIHGDAMLATGEDKQGNLIYPDTPEGKAAEARHMQYTNEALKNLYVTGAKTIADNEGASKAADWAKSHWDDMPDVAKVQMNQYLAPKMKNEAIGNAINDMNITNDAQWNRHQLSNVPDSPISGAVPGKAPLSVRNNNPGNLRDSATGQFKVFDTPEAGAAAMQSDLSAKISGNSPAMEKNFGKGYSPTLSNLITTYAPASDHNDTKGYIDAVSKATGFAPDHVLTATDIPKLQAAMTKVEAGGSGASIPQGSAFPQYPNKADMLRDNLESSVNGAVNKYLNQYPDDYYGAQLVERRARSEIGREISMEDSRLRSDRDTIQNAIGGAQTKGQPVATYEELKAIPGMQPVLDRVHSEQGEFASTLDTRIAKAAHSNTVSNSPNGFDAISTALEAEDKYTKQQKIEYLSKGLGTENPGYSITQKDFNDAKPALDLDPQIRTKLLDTMQSISKANGDIDGLGKQRAVQWYQNAMNAYNNKGEKMTDAEFAANLKASDNTMPSRQQQIANIAAKQQAANNVLVINPSGVRGYIPPENVEKALAAGFKKVQ